MKDTDYVNFTNYSPIILKQQQSHPNQILQKSPSPLSKNPIFSEETIHIKLNNIVSNNNRYCRIRDNQKSSQSANKKLANILEAFSLSKIKFSQQNRCQQSDIQEQLPQNEDNVKKSMDKQVLIRQGLQGDKPQQLSNINEYKSPTKINRNFLKEQFKSLNQSMDLVIANNNNIFFDRISNKTLREKDNFALQSYNIKTEKYESDNEQERVQIAFNNIKNYDQKLNQNQSNQFQLYETSRSFDQSKNRQQLYITNEGILKQNLLKNTKIEISMDYTTPRSVIQSTKYDNSQIQPTNINQSLYKITSQTKSQFEYSQDNYMKRCITTQNEEQQMNKKIKQIENKRYRNQMIPQLDGQVIQTKQSLDEYDFQYLQQKQNEFKDFMPIHQKILEEYQNDTLVKRESLSPFLPCKVQIQNIQLSKKYNQFLRNQKNKIIISQKQQFSPQKLISNKQSSPFYEQIIEQCSQKLPGLKQFTQGSDTINQLYDHKRKETTGLDELNLNIRRLDAEREDVKQKRKNGLSNHAGQKLNQPIKSINNTEKFYKKYSQNLQNNNHHTYTEQINPSIISYNDFYKNSLIHNNCIQTKDVLDCNFDKSQSADSSANIRLDVKSVNEQISGAIKEYQINNHNIEKQQQQNNITIQKSPLKLQSHDQKLSSQLAIFNSINYQNNQKDNQDKQIKYLIEPINQNKSNNLNSTINLYHQSLSQNMEKSQYQQNNKFKKSECPKNTDIYQQDLNQEDNIDQINVENIEYVNQKINQIDKLNQNQLISQKQKSSKDIDNDEFSEQTKNNENHDQNHKENQTHIQFEQTINQTSFIIRKLSSEINQDQNQNQYQYDSINQSQIMLKTTSQTNLSVDQMNQSINLLNQSMNQVNQSLNSIKLSTHDQKQGMQFNNNQKQDHRDENIILISSLTNRLQEVQQTNINNMTNHITSFQQQYQSPESTSKRRFNRNRNLSSYKQSKQNPNKAIQISRLDLSSNSRNCVYYSLNTSQKTICNTSQDKTIFNNNDRTKSNKINQKILNNQKKNSIYLSKTVNVIQQENEDRNQLQQFSRSVAHQNQQLINQNKEYIDIIQKQYRSSSKQRSNTENNTNLIENGFYDEPNPIQNAWNQYSIEDYVKQMKTNNQNQKNIQ